MAILPLSGSIFDIDSGHAPVDSGHAALCNSSHASVSSGHAPVWESGHAPVNPRGKRKPRQPRLGICADAIALQRRLSEPPSPAPGPVLGICADAIALQRRLSEELQLSPALTPGPAADPCAGRGRGKCRGKGGPRSRAGTDAKLKKKNSTKSLEWKKKKSKAAKKMHSKFWRNDWSANSRMYLQARRFNMSGGARTRDDEHVTVQRSNPEGNGRSRKGFAAHSTGYIKVIPEACKGRGGRKKWTGAAICQAAYAPPQQAAGGKSKAEGASHGHVMGCEMFTAGMVEGMQNQHAKQRRDDSCKEPLESYLTNNMFDETKLFVPAPGGRRAKRRKRSPMAAR